MSRLLDEIRNETGWKLEFKPMKYLVGAAVLATVITGFSSFKTTGKTELGAAFNVFSGEMTSYQPGGTYFIPSLINDFYGLDTTLRTIDLTMYRDEDGDVVDERLNFKTAEGNDVDLELIIGLRIDPTKQQYILEQVGQSTEEVMGKVGRALAESLPRDSYGLLETEQFYNAENREKASLELLAVINGVANKYGVIAENVDSRNFFWGNEDFRTAIAEKTEADEERKKVEEEITSQVPENEKLKNNETKDVNRKIADADGNYNRRIREADAYYNQKANEAEAIRAEADSEAAGIVAERKAMLSGGGKTLVQMELANAISGKPIMMIPSGNSNGSNGMKLQTTDVNLLLEQIGAARAMDKVKASK